MSLPFPPSIPLPGCFGSLVPLRGPSPLGSPRSPDLGSLRRARGRAGSLGFIPGGAGPASSSRSHICSWNCNLRRWLGWAPAGSGSGRKALGEARGSRRARGGYAAGPAARTGRCRSRWASPAAAGGRASPVAVGAGIRLAQLEREGGGWTEGSPTCPPPPRGKRPWGFVGAGDQQTLGLRCGDPASPGFSLGHHPGQPGCLGCLPSLGALVSEHTGTGAGEGCQDSRGLSPARMRAAGTGGSGDCCVEPLLSFRGSCPPTHSVLGGILL